MLMTATGGGPGLGRSLGHQGRDEGTPNLFPDRPPRSGASRPFSCAQRLQVASRTIDTKEKFAAAYASFVSHKLKMSCPRPLGASVQKISH